MYTPPKRLLRWVLGCLFFSTIALPAQVKMCSIFGNHMVLQRDVPIPIWGKATPGDQLLVTLGEEKASVVADAQGNWKVTLPALPASATPIDLTITGTGTKKLNFHDVLIGDVWIAAGQSNMDWAFFWGNGVLNTQEEMANANYPLIRDCKVGTYSQAKPQENMGGGWMVCTPKQPGSRPFTSGIERFTATGYFFARELHQRLKIPIGLINSSLGGSAIEAWLDPATAAQFPAIDEAWQKRLAAYPEKQAKYLLAKSAWDAEKASVGPSFKKYPPQPPSPPEHDITRPCGLYNAMIHPFIGYAFKGVVWYQGENNVGHATEYQSLFPALIEGWRGLMGMGNFPFYWAQLSNYNFQGRPNGTEWAYLREAQTKTLSVPNTGEAITLDIGESNEIHLHNKQEVGRRLALLALARTYGLKDVVDSGPTFDHADLNASPVKVYFKNATGGLKQLESKAANSNNSLGGFELAGEDQIFHPAEAHVDDSHSIVLVSSYAVSKPISVRYAWRNDPKNLALVNQAGLPAGPFRTDDWRENPPALKPK